MRTRYWPPLILFIASVAFGIAPLISVIIAGTLASSHGCTLHEGGVNPCVILGHDFGQLLYTMGVMGWFMFLTVPVAIYGIGSSLVMAIVVFLTRRRKRKDESGSTAH
jgi:hypothetical protein